MMIREIENALRDPDVQTALKMALVVMMAVIDEANDRDITVRAAVRWLCSIKDEVAAGQTEDELAASLFDYLEGADTC